jgi:hypothetical protein
MHRDDVIIDWLHSGRRPIVSGQEATLLRHAPMVHW